MHGYLRYGSYSDGNWTQYFTSGSCDNLVFTVSSNKPGTPVACAVPVPGGGAGGGAAAGGGSAGASPSRGCGPIGLGVPFKSDEASSLSFGGAHSSPPSTSFLPSSGFAAAGLS